MIAIISGARTNYLMAGKRSYVKFKTRDQQEGPTSIFGNFLLIELKSRYRKPPDVLIYSGKTDLFKKGYTVMTANSPTATNPICCSLKIAF